MHCIDEMHLGSSDCHAKVFVSYSRSDIDRVRAVASELRRHKVQTWIDVEDLRPGERWKEAIESALASSNAMLFFLSPLSVESSWTSVELRAAINRNIPIIPVMVEYVEISAIHPELRARHIYDMTRHPPSAAAAITARAIASRLGLAALCDVDSSSTEGEAALLVVALGMDPDLSSLWKRVDWIKEARSEVAVRYVDGLTSAGFASLQKDLNRAYHAVVSVSDGANTELTQLLIGLAAAQLGPKRVTIVDFSDKIGSLQLSAEIAQAYYVNIRR